MDYNKLCRYAANAETLRGFTNSSSISRNDDDLWKFIWYCFRFHISLVGLERIWYYKRLAPDRSGKMELFELKNYKSNPIKVISLEIVP